MTRYHNWSPCHLVPPDFQEEQLWPLGHLITHWLLRTWSATSWSTGPQSHQKAIAGARNGSNVGACEGGDQGRRATDKILGWNNNLGPLTCYVSNKCTFILSIRVIIDISSDSVIVEEFKRSPIKFKRRTQTTGSLNIFCETDLRTFSCRTFNKNHRNLISLLCQYVFLLN